MKKYRKDAMNMTMTGVTMGVGSKVISGAGGDASAISGMSAYMPVMGTVSGASATMRQMKKLKL